MTKYTYLTIRAISHIKLVFFFNITQEDQKKELKINHKFLAAKVLDTLYFDCNIIIISLYIQSQDWINVLI